MVAKSSSAKKLVALACCAAVASSAAAAAMFEPSGSQVFMGMWIDTQEEWDTPVIANDRLGHLLPVYQVAQNIPLPAYNWDTGAGGPPPVGLIEDTNSSAAVFLTVYPNQGWDMVIDQDLVDLGNQIATYDRTVFLRYAPEMQGNWNEYGFQPTAYVEQWQRMYQAIKAIAPDTIMVWAPNTAQSYPYGQTLANASTADATALDTNGDGELTIEDDAFAPYYPGDDYVDWIGLSIYYKGVDTITNTNVVQPDGYCGQILEGIDPLGGSSFTPFYENYCANKTDKACMIAESGAAYHLNNSDTGASQLAIQQAWIDGCLTNTTYYDAYPRIKLNMHFEYRLVESDGGILDDRDYRLMNDSTVLDYFVQQINAIESTYFAWANSTGDSSGSSSSGSDGENAASAWTAPPLLGCTALALLAAATTTLFL